MLTEPRCGGSNGSSVLLGGEQLEHTTGVPAPQLIALASSRGLMIRGPGGTVHLSNRTLAAVAEFAIALQDLIADPDVELDSLLEGKPAFSAADHGLLRAYGRGAGCPIADPGGCEHYGAEADHE